MDGEPLNLGPLTEAAPPPVLVPPIDLSDDDRKCAEALCETDDLVAHEQNVMRDEGIDPRLSPLEGYMWRWLVACMYSQLGGSPSDYTEEATAAVALTRADHMLEIALRFFADDHPLREVIEDAHHRLREAGYAHWTYMGINEANALEDAMRDELGERDRDE